ncbi:YcdB/YcdC domain-containing protein [Paenibacillus urinalis]|uniref:SLH domain-containing protein n=1 Tax=Paenibacillus urinalis TaxID=521520 RepID=A0AAX3MWP8_9BACL|nr:YcdB/YcdC domain-containing protein [Paenibacillus urinalis]WDH82045.1 hypothetical protein PUW23_21630 [Paenibacillus urinalis]
MKQNENKNKKSPSMKRVAAALAAVMLGVHTQGVIQEVSAAQVSVGEETALSITDSTIPKGAKISSETAHKNILKLFPELSKATLTSVQLGSNGSYPPAEEKVWDLSYSITRGNSTSSFSASVSSQTGEVLSAHLPEYLIQRGDSEEHISEEEAAEISAAFLHEAIPDLKEGEYSSLENMDQGMNPLFGRTEYPFSYQLKVNGLPAVGNIVYISVNDSGEVTSYTRMTGHSNYPSPVPKVTKEEAKKRFEESLDLQLAYVPVNYAYNNGSKEYYLAYVPSNTGEVVVDAITGKAVDVYASGESDISILDESLPKKDVSFEPAAKPPARDEVVALLKNKFPSLKEYTAIDVSLNRSSQRGAVKKVWHVRFSHQKGNEVSDISTQVDAETGQVIDYSEWYHSSTDNGDASIKEISKQAAKDQAAELVLSLVPNAVTELRLSQMISMEDGYNFVYSRYLNGLRVIGDNVNISMTKSGQVNTFYTSLSAEIAQLPEVKEASISQEEAQAAYLDSTEMVLSYQESNPYYITSEEIPPVKLVYMPSQGSAQLYSSKVIDGTTGKLHEMYSSGANHTNALVVDIAGHESEEVMQRMITHGVLVPDIEGKIEPERNITKGDWYTYLARALDPHVQMSSYYSSNSAKLFADIDMDSPYYFILNRLIEQGWVEADPEIAFAPNHSITRGQLSELIISMLQYDKLAKFYQQGNDLPSVADAAQIDNKGAASLAIRLGILPLIEGRFLPDRPVTVSEAAEVINRLAELQDKLDYFTSDKWAYRYY